MLDAMAFVTLHPLSHQLDRLVRVIIEAELRLPSRYRKCYNSDLLQGWERASNLALSVMCNGMSCPDAKWVVLLSTTPSKKNNRALGECRIGNNKSFMYVFYVYVVDLQQSITLRIYITSTSSQLPNVLSVNKQHDKH